MFIVIVTGIILVMLMLFIGMMLPLILLMMLEMILEDCIPTIRKYFRRGG